MILWQPKLADRVEMYKKLVNLMEVCLVILFLRNFKIPIKSRDHYLTDFFQHLRRLNNFNALLALLSGLNNSSIHRLKFTRQEIPENIIKVSLFISTNFLRIFRFSMGICTL